MAFRSEILSWLALSLGFIMVGTILPMYFSLLLFLYVSHRSLVGPLDVNTMGSLD